jgi:uncharacterized protein (DUF58 family)
MIMTESTLLLEEVIRRKLEPLSLTASKVRAGAMKGDRRSIRRGTSIEFADYRNYTPGDDLRRMDWNVYARLGKPYLKLLEDEEDLAVHILLDCSASMGFPLEAPLDQHKLTFAQRLTAGLSYIALAENDRLTISTGADAFGPTRGRAQIIPMLRYMHARNANGTTDLNAMLTAYALRPSRPGLLFIVSDMFSPSGFVDGLNQVLGKGYEVILIHILSRDEIEPDLTGDLRLIDAESGTAQEVSIEPGLRALYVQRLAEWQDDIRMSCLKRGVPYIPVITDTPWERVILDDLRRAGVVA